MGFLQVLAKKLVRKKIANPVLDTAALYKWWRNREDRHGLLAPDALRLATICQALNIPQYSAHQAFFDALTCANLFIKLMTYLEAAGIFTFRDMLRAARPRLGNGGI